MATTAAARSVELGKMLEQATRVSDLAQTAFRAVSALEEYILSPYFAFDSVALGDSREADVAELLMERIEESRMSVEPLDLLETMRVAEQLYGVVLAAVKRECGQAHDA